MDSECRMATVAEFRVHSGDEFPITGYAAKFNELSQVLWNFRERIHPKAFDRALREKQDVRALVDHDPSKIIGRTTAGTLKLSTDKIGLVVAIRPPDTTAGRDLMVSIERRDVTQMSFAFNVREEKMTFAKRDSDEDIDIRELLDVDLFDVSAVTYPAYEQTEIDVRSRKGVRIQAYRQRVKLMVVE